MARQIQQCLAEEEGHARKDIREGYENLYRQVVNEYSTTCGRIDDLEALVTSPRHKPPVRVTQDHNPKWKCESNLVPAVLEISASLATTDSCTRSLRGALGIKSLPEGQFQVPPGIDHTIAKEYVLSVLDEDLKLG